jgi:HAE1 family hydrophobic/amphiphilic exporter-1
MIAAICACLWPVSGLRLRGMSVDIHAQIGVVVLVTLTSKNAILIVEFAKQAQDAGASIRDAAVDAARTRLRPILMTSLGFTLGVVLRSQMCQFRTCRRKMDGMIVTIVRTDAPRGSN